MFDRCKSTLIRIAPLVFCAGLATAQTPGPSAIPGTLNYFEGSVSIDGRALGNGSASSPVTLQPNQTIETAQGRAEVLLTPGVFLRLGNHSAAQILSPDLTDTRVALVRGEAMLEVAEIFKENSLRVVVNGNATLIAKLGLYGFNADHPELQVYDGEAFVTAGDRQVKVTKGHQAPLVGVVKAEKFDPNHAHGSLYAWSSLRSEYVAEASMQSARTLVAGGEWYGAGWYWNPWWDMYGFVPGYGVLYSSFGYPFFSPGLVYAAPYYGFRHPFGFRGAGAVRGFAAAPHFSGGGFAGGHGGGGHR